MNQIELRLPAGIRHTSRDVILPEGLSKEQCLDYGRFLWTAETALSFWKSRWLGYVRKNHGLDEVKAQAAQLEIEFSELKAVDALNKLEIRDSELTPEHHFVLAKAKLDGTGQDMWAKLALRDELSAHELQESIRKGVVTRIESLRSGGGKAKGLATFEGLRMQWEILRRQIDPVLKDWTAEEAAVALEALAPLEEFITTVRARFGLAKV